MPEIVANKQLNYSWKQITKNKEILFREMRATCKRKIKSFKGSNVCFSVFKNMPQKNSFTGTKDVLLFGREKIKKKVIPCKRENWFIAKATFMKCI